MKRDVACAFLLFALATSVSGQALPLSVRVDMLKTQLAGHLKAQEYTGALQTIQKLKATGTKLPPSYEYFEGKALFESGQRAASYDKFVHYAETQGRQGVYYQETIAYLIKAEQARNGAPAGKMRPREAGPEASEVHPAKPQKKIVYVRYNNDFEINLSKLYVPVTGAIKIIDTENGEERQLEGGLDYEIKVLESVGSTFKVLVKKHGVPVPGVYVTSPSDVKSGVNWNVVKAIVNGMEDARRRANLRPVQKP